MYLSQTVFFISTPSWIAISFDEFGSIS
jgi:hypothetical protein